MHVTVTPVLWEPMSQGGRWWPRSFHFLRRRAGRGWTGGGQNQAWPSMSKAGQQGRGQRDLGCPPRPHAQMWWAGCRIWEEPLSPGGHTDL